MFSSYSGEMQEALQPVPFHGESQWESSAASGELYPELYPEIWHELPGEVYGEWETPGRGRVAAPVTCLVHRDFEVLDFFKFKSPALEPFHLVEIRRIARRITASLRGPQPIRRVHIVGHADVVGDPGFNQRLGTARAIAVAARVRADLGAVASSVTITTATKGSTSAAASNNFDRGRACNRRVEVFFNGTGTNCKGCSFRHFLTRYDMESLPDLSQIGSVPAAQRIGISVNPTLTLAQKRLRQADVQALVPELLRRRNARAGAALTRTVPPPTAAPAALMPRVTRLSQLQLALYRRCFPDGSGGIRFNDFQHCFEQFSNGELRDVPAHPDQGGPNGAFFFLFAEFAFLCIESGVDSALWLQALHTFVKTQEIFIHVFRPAPPRTPPVVGAPLPAPCSPPRRPLDSAPGTSNGFQDVNFNAMGQSNFARKLALRRKYARIRTIRALRIAAGQNLLRAQCMP